MSFALDAGGELLALELLEEVCELPPAQQEERITARLSGRADAQAVRERITRLLAIEGSLGAVGAGLGPGLAALDTQPAELQSGSRFGEFEILRMLGRGGMGTVYLARQAKPERTVALKVLDARLAAELGPRLEREGHLLARLSHPNIAQVHLMGVEGELPWVAMEHVDGARTITQACEGLDRAERLALFDQVLEAVQHGHGKGIVHRDLKPENILVDVEGRVRVIDFGIASWLDGREEAARALSEGQLGADSGEPVFGTLAYLPPEGFTGSTDVRGDVFGLGLVLHELLLEQAARQLESGPTADVIAAAQEPILLRPGELPRPLEAILARSLEQNPDARYRSVESFARDLRAVREHRPVEALVGAGAVFHPFACWLRRNWLWAAALILAFGGLGAGLVLALRANHREAEQFARAENMRRAAIDISLELVTDFAREVSKLSGGLETRRAMISSGIGELERLAQQTEGLGSDTVLELARAYLSLGDVLGYVRVPNLGDFDEAERAYDRAEALLAELVANGDLGAEPRIVGHRLDERRATLLRVKGDFPGAIEGYAALESDLEALERADLSALDRARVQVDRAQAMYLRAGLLGASQDHNGARGLARRAVDLQRDVLATAPEDYDLIQARFHLQQSWSFVAVASSQLGDHDAAAEAFAQARDVLVSLMAERPDDRMLKASHAGGLVQELDALRRAGQFDRALEVLELSRAELRALIEADPSDVRERTNEGVMECLAMDLFIDLARAADDEAQASDHEATAFQCYQAADRIFKALEAEGVLSGPAKHEWQRAQARFQVLER